MNTGDILFETPHQKTTEIVFSPNSTYVAAWEQFYTTPQNPQGSDNYEIFNIKTGDLVKSVVHKRRTGW